MLHGVPLNPLLRPDVGETVRPRTPELFLKQREQLGFPLGVDRRGASCVSNPAPLNAEWCRAAVNSMRTVIRSCRSHERIRRFLLRRAEPLPASQAPDMTPAEVPQEVNTTMADL